LAYTENLDGKINIKPGKLRELKGNADSPWIVMGDFNEIAFCHEKEGGNWHPNTYMGC
jgi:hypothetical protein